MYYNIKNKIICIVVLGINTLKVKNGKFLGFKSVSVNTDNNCLVAGPIIQIAVYADVTSDTATEPSVGR